MTKISIIGAGSMFTRHIASDIMSIPGLEKGIIALVDIDGERLKLAQRLVEMVRERLGRDWVIQASTDRREVMGGIRTLLLTKSKYTVWRLCN